MSSSIPLSYHQERLWFIDTFEKGKLYAGSPVYHNLPLILKIEGSIDKPLLVAALQYLTIRHEVLRARLNEGEFPSLSIEDSAVITLAEHLISANNSSADNSAVLDAVIASTQQEFDLQQGPLHRAELFSDGNQQQYFLWLFHHFIADRSSLKILFEELVAVYTLLEQGKVPTLPALDLQYVDFSVWQRELPEDAIESLLLHWKRELKGNPQILEIATDHPRDHIHMYEGEVHAFTLPAELVRALQEVAAPRGATTKEVAMTAFLVLLQHYSGLAEMVIGTLGNNHDEHLPQAVGPVDNLLVLRTMLDSDASFAELLARVARSLAEAGEYQDMPFEQLSTLLNPAKDMSRTAFFDILFHYEIGDSVKATAHNTWTRQETNRGLGKYDFNLLLVEEAQTIEGYLTFNKKYFTPATIQQLCDNFTYLLTQVVATPDRAIAELPFLAPAQAEPIMQLLDFTAVDFPRHEHIVSLFAQQAANVPGNIALVMAEEQLTYAELDQYSNQFAYYLRQHDLVQPGDFVAVSLARSTHMIGVLLGILKAGGCYIPMDPAYPQDRVAFILEDSGSKALVNQAFLEEFLALRPQLPAAAISQPIDPQQLAYVIYTSGTTGRPKGVKVSHRNVVRLLFNEQNLFDFTAQDVWTMFHSYCFDFSVWEMYGALLYGGKLVMVPEIVAKDTELFCALLAQQNVTILNQTPSAFYRLMQAEAAQAERLALRSIIFGGEALAPYLLHDWAVKYPATTLINMYGITETTVHVTYKEIGPAEIESGISNIGKPIPTLGCYVLDAQQQLVPRGVVGELYVFGEGVANGYLNRDELTAQRFVHLPLAPGKCLYRSGDLARITHEGDLEYLGRIDNQVKIRGHRIELGEIETNLLKHAEVATAIVIALTDKDGDNFLVAYYTGDHRLSAKELKRYLQLQVPAYMVPAYFVHLDQIPLTSNGKVDRHQLPAPTTDLREEAALYVAPRNEVEAQLAEIWQELLGIAQVSVKDNFFDLGGHSLKATQLISRISERLHAQLRLSEIFAHPILEELARIPALHAEQKTALLAVPQAQIQVHYPLSPAQKRLWILQQMETSSSVYNMSSGYLIASAIVADQLQQAVAQLLDRHEILRTEFKKLANEDVAQFILPTLATEAVFQAFPEVVSLQQVTQRLQAEALVPFDLAAAPLLKIRLYKVADEQYVLGYVMHHIISDGWSMNVFFSELLHLYQQLNQPAPVALAALPFQYKDYAVWYHDQLRQGALNPQRAYWQAQFSQSWKRIELGAQKPRPAVKTYAGKVAEFTVSASTRQAVEQACHQLGGTLFMGLFTVVNALIARYTSLTDVVLGVPTAGRDFGSIEKQIGFYVNTLALRTQFSLTDSLQQVFEKVKATVLTGFEQQNYPFDMLVDDLKLQRDVSRTPLFDIMVVLQNTQDVHVTPGQPLADVLVTPLSYAGESSKFDLTWFFVETAEQELVLRLEYNTDLYEPESIQQLAAHFTQLLHGFLEQPAEPLQNLQIFSLEELSDLAELHRQAQASPVEQAGLSTPAPRGPGRVEAAVGPKEVTLLAVWQDVLALESISRTDDFFALGGDSIKAIQLVSKLKKHNLHLSVPEVMQQPVLQHMALKLREDAKVLVEESMSGPVPLSPIQHYFFSAVTTVPAHYNQSVMLHSAAPVEPQLLASALQALTARHDMLRAVYQQEDGRWTQHVLPQQALSLEVHDLRGAALEENAATVEQLSAKAQSSFQLAQGPLFKAVLYQQQDQDTLLLCAHHLLVDGVSWRILLEDFQELYDQARQGLAPQAFARTHSYKTWVTHLEQLAHSPLIAEAAPKWQTVETKLTVLPKELPAEANREQEAGQVQLQLSAAQTKALTQAAHRVLKADVQDLLLAALGQSMQTCFGVQGLGLMMESHGRDSVLSLDLSRTVGWFTALFPILLPAPQADELVYLMEVKEAVREYSGSSSQYGIWKYLAAGTPGVAADVCFNYLGHFSASASTKSEFTLSNDGKGAERDAHQQRLFALEVNAAIVDGEAQLSLKYSTQQYQPATMQRLLQAWQAQVLRLVSVCEEADDKYLTPSDLNIQGIALEKLLKLQKQCAVEDMYPLSPMQQTFFYYHARYPKSTAYFEQTRYRLQGHLQPALVKEALQLLAARHQVMRTLFRDDLADQLVQVVLTDGQPTGHFTDISAAEAPEAELERFAAQDRAAGFDLRHELPIRWHLFRLADDLFEFVFSYHHILMDGWCMPLIMHEFQTIYSALVAQTPSTLPRPTPYVEYIKWLEQYPAEVGKRYWQQYVSGYAGIASMGRPEETHEVVRDLEYAEITLAGEALSRLQQVTRENGITLNEVMQTLWGVYLGSKTNRNDVLFGAIVSGRPAELPGVESMVGLFINTLPVRVRFDGSDQLLSVMHQLREQAIAALPYHYTPLSDMQAGRPAGALFDHLMVFRNYPMSEAADAPWELLQVKAYEPNSLDFSIHVLPDPETLRIRFVYLPDKYTLQEMNHLKATFEELVQKFSTAPASTVAELQQVIETRKNTQRKSSVANRLAFLKK